MAGAGGEAGDFGTEQHVLRLLRFRVERLSAVALNRSEWQKLADDRHADAEALLAASRWSAAYYTVRHLRRGQHKVFLCDWS